MAQREQPSRTTGPWLSAVLLCLLPGLSAPLAAEDAGLITGSVDPLGKVRAVSVVDRQSGQRFPGSVDPTSGAFVVGSLPLEAAYDCIIDYSWSDSSNPAAPRLEGVNMKVPRSDYVEEQPLSSEDIATIQDKIRKMNRFEDVVEILAVDGNIRHAAILLNKLRTQPFYGSKPGEVVWRLELWHYERPEETWHKALDEMFVVLYRERIQRSVYDKKSITLDPALGGLRPTADTPEIDLGKVTLPAAKPGVRMRPRKGHLETPVEEHGE